MEIGDPDPATVDLRIVDVYADGRWLTCADNIVYDPQFVGSVCDDLERIISEHQPERDNVPFPDQTDGKSRIGQQHLIEHLSQVVDASHQSLVTTQSIDILLRLSLPT